MTSEQSLQILATILFSVGSQLEQTLDQLGPDFEDKATRVEDALNQLTREWPDIVPIKKEDRL